MFSKLILSDPYFHANHDEKTAKEALNDALNENFLFCPGKKENEILLAYKAEYNQANQIRTINLNYYKSDGSINHNSLGSHPTLHSASQALIKFLHGWTSKPFIPVPFIKAPIIRPLLKECDLLGNIPNEIVNNHIFTLFDRKAMASMVQVCKSWYQTGTKLQFEIEKQEFAKQQEETTILNGKIKFIFETIKIKITPEREGVKNPQKVLTHNGYTISEPMEYGCQIICNISTPAAPKGNYVFINKLDSKIRLTGSSELLTYKDIQGVEEVCLHGKNPFLDFQDNEDQNRLAFNP